MNEPTSNWLWLTRSTAPAGHQKKPSVRQLQALLTANRWRRRYQRRLTRRIKHIMGIPDAYGDLLEIIRAHRPAQILDLAVSTARPSPGEPWTLRRRLRGDFGFGVTLHDERVW